MSRRWFVLLAALALLPVFFTERRGDAKPSAEDGRPPDGITATFSIVAVDPETGTCGAAVASKYPAVGKVVPYVRAGVGAFCTQHYHVPKWGEPALDMLQQGKRPEAAIF